RRPNRSAERPPSSKKPPNVSVYAVTTHCRSEVLKCRLRPIAGSATLVTVASRMTMNWARQTVTISAVLERTAATALTCDASATPSDTGSSGRHVAVAALAKFLDEPGTGRIPTELGFGLGRERRLIYQQHFREVIAQAHSRLLVRPRHRPGSACGIGGRLGELGDGRVEPIAYYVAATRRIVLEDQAEEVREIGDVNRGPALAPAAQHDQVAGVVARGSEQDSRHRPSPVSVCDPRDDDDSTHVRRPEHAALDRLLPRHERGRIDRGVLGDRGVGSVDPRAADVQER